MNANDDHFPSMFADDLLHDPGDSHHPVALGYGPLSLLESFEPGSPSFRRRIPEPTIAELDEKRKNARAKEKKSERFFETTDDETGDKIDNATDDDDHGDDDGEYVLPPTGWMRFCKEQRPRIIAANPDITFGGVLTATQAAWAELSDSEKKKYESEARLSYETCLSAM